MVDAKTGQKQTLVEEGTQFKGSITSSCPVVVRGRIEGDIETPSLTVSSSGSVQGKAKVGAVISEGEIAGEFDAETVQLSGKVNDDTVIQAKTLEIKLATEKGKMQVVFGNTELKVGDDPQAEASGAPEGDGPKSAKGGS
jgi:cytoskeletal protein CcmA (bactofilin family)